MFFALGSFVLTKKRINGVNLARMDERHWVPEDETKMSHALEKVAKELGVKNIRAIAVAYVMQKAPNVFPIIGGRKVEHLVANLEALDIWLSDEQVNYLENIIPFNVGLPQAYFVRASFHSFGIDADISKGNGSQTSPVVSMTIHTQRMPVPHALPPPAMPVGSN
ncbi:putative aryl-alcohol dehydrogenase aad14 [Stygiomarasmius scandens]|uniref:Aryl-alcohol dehydrogenase aad14 n=1 Tax=Marasmiellus scandens TaxID=2682957 RepID=A0ABR1J7H9_9AGAR